MTEEAFGKILQDGSPVVAAGIVLVAFAAGGWITRRDARDWPLSKGKRLGLFASVFIAGLAGCAIPAFFAEDIIGRHALLEWRGPKTILGGLLGGFAGATVFKAVTRTAYDTSDAFARGTCLMLAIGRLGCAARHCCFGIEVPAAIGLDFGDGVARLPVQVLEAGAVFGLFLFLHALHRRGLARNRRFFIFLLAYGLMRFGFEFGREQVAGGWFGLGLYQWLALATAAIGGFQILKRAPAPEPEPAGALR
ncbi:MAG: prolipoprotein diacylglyceryl transferase [Candidatus Brocadiae bacterium]|nr:prolipoprotein diacylglyceryl transferase [Candidatus Brocadiia bacterium]